jgi:hypothetical protein
MGLGERNVLDNLTVVTIILVAREFLRLKDDQRPFLCIGIDKVRVKGFESKPCNLRSISFAFVSTDLPLSVLDESYFIICCKENKVIMSLNLCDLTAYIERVDISKTFLHHMNSVIHYI